MTFCLNVFASNYQKVNRYSITRKKPKALPDIFETRIRKNTIDQDEFFLFSESYRGRFLTLGFSYGFGKGEAMQYSGARRR